MTNNVHRLESITSLPLPDEELRGVIEIAKDWAIMHGLAMRSVDNFSTDTIQFARFMLLPSPFPRKEFQKAVDIQPVINELIHRIAHDPEYLRSCLKEVLQIDEFTRNLFKIYETVLEEGITQPISLGLIRSDVMLESNHDKQINSCRHPCIKQVEMNTIAASSGWFGPVASDIHRFILQQLGYSDKLKNLPINSATTGLCEGMIEAWNIYSNNKAVILFIIEEVTFNICDQRFHEFEIVRLQPKLKVIRCTLTELASTAYLNKDNELIVSGHTVAVVYFRAGYSPDHYPSEKEWNVRLLIERSRAIKCPSIQYHLAGTKKVQQCLARPGGLERFLKDADQIKAVKQIFTGIYSLDFDEWGDEAVQMALETPERFVLKPQREGGGNNIYDSDIKKFITNIKDSRERTAWILMERIFPPVTSNYIISAGKSDIPKPVDVVSELGMFGVIIGDSNKIMCNRQVGHLLRSKLVTANETGLLAGAGAIDSPYLFD